MNRRALAGLAVIVALAAVPSTSASSGPEAGLRAGAAVTDITPENGQTMLGYVRPDITVTGVHTRLMARALVLEQGATRVALLATDLAFALDKDSLVARVADLGFTHATVLYTGTHTHTGPESAAGWQLDQMAKAIRTAYAVRRPALAAWGSARVGGVNRNRSVEPHLADHGMDLFYGEGAASDDPQGEAHTVDEMLRVLRVDGTDRRPIAAWVEFPVHLTTSTPYAHLWDADLAGATLLHLGAAVRQPGFVGLYANGASGDLMPRFDAWNAHVLMDLHGRRLATGAHVAWRAAAPALSRAMPVDVRWTRRCYCGQDVEPGRTVSREPVFGLPFLGGSEDGASIFHEPLATEGRRRPTELADPVHGRKITVLPSRPLDVHESTPEFQVLRIGDRLLLAAPGEPSVEMARRFVAAVRAVLPRGVSEAFVVGLSNDYLGYFTTPEEYEVQHYEGGHTVFGVWTSLLAQQAFVDLARALATGAPAPAPDSPATLGTTPPGAASVGATTDGELTAQPPAAVERHGLVSIGWSGGDGGTDRPLDAPFLVLERNAGGRWQPVATDLGNSFVWQEGSGSYAARYDVPGDLPLGTYRLRVVSAGYQLATSPFEVLAADGLAVLGALLVDGGRTVLFRAQNPPPDAALSVTWRPISPSGGTLRFSGPGGVRTARWVARLGGWAAPAQGLRSGSRVVVAAGGLVDGAGNRSGESATVVVGQVRLATWPGNMGVGGGRAPGPFGNGSFPP